MHTLKQHMTSGRARIAAAVLAVLVIGGILAVTAIPALASHTTEQTLAATPTTASYCALYTQTLAAKLNVSAGTLQSDTAAALNAAINQAVKDRKLTQARATKLEQKLASDGSVACHRIGKFGDGTHAVLHQIRTDVTTAVATKLGYTDAKALHAALKGTDIVTLAKSKGVDQTALNATITTTVQTELAALATKGSLTSAQETQLLAKVTKLLTAGQYRAFGLR